MKQLLNRIEKILYRSTAAGELLGYFVLGGIVLLTVVDIILRYVFNQPLAYTVEVIELALCITIFLAIAVCTAYRCHVKIDLLLMRFSRRRQAAINSFIYLIATGVFGLMVWRFVIYAIQTQDMGLVTMMLKLPYHPFILFIAFCTLLTSLLFLSQFIHFVIEAVRK